MEQRFWRLVVVGMVMLTGCASIPSTSADHKFHDGRLRFIAVNVPGDRSRYRVVHTAFELEGRYFKADIITLGKTLKDFCAEEGEVAFIQSTLAWNDSFYDFREHLSRLQPLNLTTINLPGNDDTIQAFCASFQARWSTVRSCSFEESVWWHDEAEDPPNVIIVTADTSDIQVCGLSKSEIDLLVRYRDWIGRPNRYR